MHISIRSSSTCAHDGVRTSSTHCSTSEVPLREVLTHPNERLKLFLGSSVWAHILWPILWVRVHWCAQIGMVLTAERALGSPIKTMPPTSRGPVSLGSSGGQ